MLSVDSSTPQVRANFYATILSIALTPENDDTVELTNRLYEVCAFYGFALVLTAVIQTGKRQLDLYHAIFVMQIIFTLDFVYINGIVFDHSDVILKSLTV